MNRLALLLSVPVLFLSSCGSIKTEAGSAGAPGATAARAYSRVVVKDFRSTITDDPQNTVAPFVAKFADRIASEIRTLRPGVSVTRNGPVDASTLVISGEVTRLMEGNAALRLFVGMGAGSAYFDATVRMTSSTGAAVTTVKVDKNSWGLGGIMASQQTVDSFIIAGAKKTAAEVALHLK